VDVQVIQTQEHPLAEMLNDRLAGTVEARFAVAFLSTSGLRAIEKGLSACLDSGGQIEFIVGLDFRTTEPGALRWLSERPGTAGQIRCFCYRNPQDAPLPVFHPKLYLLTDRRREKETLVIGSSNLTGGGLQGNVEVNAIITGAPTDIPIVQARDIYHGIRNTPSVFMPDANFLSLYEGLFERAHRRWQERPRDPAILSSEESKEVEEAEARLPHTAHTQIELIVLALRDLQSKSPDGWVHLQEIYNWTLTQAHAEQAAFKWDTFENSIRGRINENVADGDGANLFHRRGGMEGRMGQYRLSPEGDIYPVRSLVEEGTKL